MSEGKVRPFIQKYYPEYYQWKDYPIDKCAPIRTNKEEWGILGNLYSAPLVVDGVEFASSEQLFQMMKFTDRDTLIAIYKSRGMGPKRIAQGAEKKSLCRPDWGQNIVDCMKFCLQTKYEQCEDFKATLHRTNGLIIVEDESKRKKIPDTWGAVREGDKFVGSNLLGRLLMELRDNGKLEYHLPEDMFDFLKFIKS